MEEKPIFRYFTGNEADKYTYYKIPKVLFTNKFFNVISTEAKVLYGLMLERVGLSIKNGWFDDQKRAYIFFSVEETMVFLNCKKNKAIKIIAELDAENGVGLIEKKRQGQGKPTKIYVKNFFIPVDNSIQDGSEVGKTNFKKVKKSTSKGLKSQPLEVGKPNPSNKESSKSDFSDTESNPSSPEEKEKGRTEVLAKVDRCSQMIKRNIGYDQLVTDHPLDRDVINECYELILETVISEKDKIVVGKDCYPTEYVKSRFGELEYSHIEYVLDCLKKSTAKVKNPKKYMLAILFNATGTRDIHYRLDANHDMHNPVEL